VITFNGLFLGSAKESDNLRELGILINEIGTLESILGQTKMYWLKRLKLGAVL